MVDMMEKGCCFWETCFIIKSVIFYTSGRVILDHNRKDCGLQEKKLGKEEEEKEKDSFYYHKKTEVKKTRTNNPFIIFNLMSENR